MKQLNLFKLKHSVKCPCGARAVRRKGKIYLCPLCSEKQLYHLNSYKKLTEGLRYDA